MDRGIFGPWKGPENGSKEQGIMIPSLEELRKRLVPVVAPDSVSDSFFKRNPRVSTTPTRSAPPTSSEFLVLRQDLPQFGPRSTIVCRLCRRRSECSVILRPKRLKLGRSEIERSSLEGWLKHDFVFFGESYLCEECAKAGGFI
jgi:hypothetical protein